MFINDILIFTSPLSVFFKTIKDILLQKFIIKAKDIFIKFLFIYIWPYWVFIAARAFL